jgi:hypothetical protein
VTGTFAPSNPNRTNSRWSVVTATAASSLCTHPAAADHDPITVDDHVTPSSDIWYPTRTVRFGVAPSSHRDARTSFTSVVSTEPEAASVCRPERRE